jgi:hypothetical protein
LLSVIKPVTVVELVFSTVMIETRFPAVTGLVKVTVSLAGEVV